MHPTIRPSWASWEFISNFVSIFCSWWKTTISYMHDQGIDFVVAMSESLHSVCARYHVPRSWFKPSGNLLVIFEEKGGDPEKITFARRKTSSICSLIAEDYPSADQKSSQEAGSKNSNTKASVHLQCPQNGVISAVKFASFGTPTGKCGSYSVGECHDPNSISVVEKVGNIIPSHVKMYLHFIQIQKWK